MTVTVQRKIQQQEIQQILLAERIQLEIQQVQQIQQQTQPIQIQQMQTRKNKNKP